MKKIVSLFMILAAILTVVACTEVENTLEITKMPPTQFEVGKEHVVEFEFKIDGKDVYSVTWDKNQYKYKLDDSSVEESLVTSVGISITPMDFSTVGVKTVIIKYNTLTAQFQYEVKPASVSTGDGTASNPYLINRTSDLISRLSDLANNAKKVYFKLESDLDLGEIGELQLDVKNIVIDGSKALGGNYKLSNLRDTLFNNISDSTLKNIDFVDARTEAHIIGKNGTDIVIDNVNITGNSFTTGSAYFDKVEGQSLISNSSNYATVVSVESTSAGFIRRVDLPASKLIIRNSTNHGTIQTAYASGRTGAFATSSGYGKLEIENSSNKGKVQYYITLEQSKEFNVEDMLKLGAFSLVGADLGTSNQDWININKESVKIDKVSIDNSNRPEFITTSSPAVTLDDQGNLTISFDQSLNVASYRLAVFKTANTYAKKDDGTLGYSGVTGGSVSLLNEVIAEDSLAGEVNLINLSRVRSILNNPYGKGIVNSMQVNTSGIFVVQVLEEGVEGYNAYRYGNYRVVLPTDKYSLNVMIYAYNASNQLVAASSFIDSTFEFTVSAN